jgi:3-oxoadipate CoA-transferase alpha subunit
MIDKRFDSALEAMQGIEDGATVLISGFGESGNPTELCHALLEHGAKDLTVVSNNAGNGRHGMAKLIGSGNVRKVICSFPRSSHSFHFTKAYRAGKIELETVPQGTLAERIRAAGAGIPAFYTPTSVGTPLAEGKEIRQFDGRDYVMEHAFDADVALVKAHRGDRWGNLTYRKAQRNFGPPMCMAGRLTIVQVQEVVDLGDIAPEIVVTPSIFVDRIVRVADPINELALIQEEFGP